MINPSCSDRMMPQHAAALHEQRLLRQESSIAVALWLRVAVSTVLRLEVGELVLTMRSQGRTRRRMRREKEEEEDEGGEEAETDN